MGRTLRAFVALKPPDKILRHAEVLQGELKARGFKLRWVRPQNIHLTLKFLGDIPLSHVDDVVSAMQRAVRGQAPLELTHQGMGAFPGIKRPRILWTGLGGDLDRLQYLVEQLSTEFEPLGFEREKRHFKAHLTLGRIKARLDPKQLLQSIQELGSYRPIGFTAQKVVLYQSELSPNGAVYTAKAHVGLTQ